MKKIISYKKNINFNTMISEITSISLDHELDKKDNCIEGNFTVSGEYKLTDSSENTERFSYDLPFKEILDGFNLDNAKMDIDDFYYEIINEKILSVNIDVLVDNIEEIKIESPRCIEEELEIKEPKEIIKEIKDDSKETYKSYTVYIVRENDTLETIINKYETTKELLEDYNDLTELKIGDKIIIPC